MKIGVSGFPTEQAGDPGAIAREAEHLGFESVWVADHVVIPVRYTTLYPCSADGTVPEFFAHLADPFVALAAASAPISKRPSPPCRPARISKATSPPSTTGFSLRFIQSSPWLSLSSASLSYLP